MRGGPTSWQNWTVNSLVYHGIWRFPKMGPPLVTIHFNRIFQYKSSILGIPHDYGTSRIFPHCTWKVVGFPAPIKTKFFLKEDMLYHQVDIVKKTRNITLACWSKMPSISLNTFWTHYSTLELYTDMLVSSPTRAVFKSSIFPFEWLFNGDTYP